MEIELKITVENSKPLLDLLKMEGTFSYEDHQVDEYHVPAHRDFIKEKPIKEWLRLRNSNGTFYVTYKIRSYDFNGISNYADELETKIADLDTMRKIFAALDFKPLITVNKLRRSWMYKDYEISFDSVEDLGEFIEIEYKGTDTVDPDKTTDEMMQFIVGLNCGKIERPRKGYPWMLLEKKGLL